VLHPVTTRAGRSCARCSSRRTTSSTSTDMLPPSDDLVLHRRDLLRMTASAAALFGLGHGNRAVAQTAERLLAAAGGSGPDPLAPKAPHHRPTAKRLIVLFMHGGPSQVDTFDYKPLL